MHTRLALASMATMQTFSLQLVSRIACNMFPSCSIYNLSISHLKLPGGLRQSAGFVTLISREFPSEQHCYKLWWISTYTPVMWVYWAPKHGRRMREGHYTCSVAPKTCHSNFQDCREIASPLSKIYILSSKKIWLTKSVRIQLISRLPRNPTSLGFSSLLRAISLQLETTKSRGLDAVAFFLEELLMRLRQKSPDSPLELKGQYQVLPHIWLVSSEG